MGDQNQNRMMFTRVSHTMYVLLMLATLILGGEAMLGNLARRFAHRGASGAPKQRLAQGGRGFLGYPQKPPIWGPGNWGTPQGHGTKRSGEGYRHPPTGSGTQKHFA